MNTPGIKKKTPGRPTAVLLLLMAAGCAAGGGRVPPSPRTRPAAITFEDATAATGLADHLHGWVLGHGGAWGDLTGNGRPDLYIGAYADRPVYGEEDAPIPNMLFLNEPGGFHLSPAENIRLDRQRARTSMVLAADLDNSGRLDLLVGTHGAGPATRLFENRGDGSFREIEPEASGWRPHDFHLRNATAVDLDRDGRLDLVFIDGTYRGRGQRVRVYRNRGGFRFEEVGAQYGFPPGDTRGLGLAVGDVNNNGRPDFFVAHSNRLFVSRDDGTYAEYRPGFFREPEFSDMPCGAAFADLTGNDLLDLVFTVHGVPGQVFLYVNRGINPDGMPVYEDATAAAGLAGTFRRHTSHLALVDVDNNGRRDILLSIAHRDAEGRLQPLVLRNTGTVNGVPRFAVPADIEVIGHTVVGPVGDYDRDGRLDIFLAPWSGPAHLFRNTTDGGNFLVVRVAGRAPDLNPMGIGATVRLYRAGRAGRPADRLGRGDIFIGSGYASGEEALAHFGLGPIERCDVVVSWQGREVRRENVAANQYLEITVE